MILARWDNHDRCSDVNASMSRPPLASVAGRITVSLVMLLPFRLIWIRLARRRDSCLTPVWGVDTTGVYSALRGPLSPLRLGASLAAVRDIEPERPQGSEVLQEARRR